MVVVLLGWWKEHGKRVVQGVAVVAEPAARAPARGAQAGGADVDHLPPDPPRPSRT